MPTDQLHPVLSLSRDPIVVAEITAALIRSDSRSGAARRLPEATRYALDTNRTGNLLRSPEETARAGMGQCFDLTRAEGAFAGTHVGCVRTPIGIHVFLAFRGDGGDALIYDVSRLRGMDEEPDYEGAAYAPIWPNGGGPTGHADPPPGLSAMRQPQPSAYVSAMDKLGARYGTSIGGVSRPPSSARGPAFLPKGSCPGSCAIPQRRPR